MTKIDLRIKYKSETGNNPVSEVDSQHACLYWVDKLKPDYVAWLEGTGYYAQRSRTQFMKETGSAAGWYDHKRNFSYFRAYKLWLENRKLETYTVLEKIKR